MTCVQPRGDSPRCPRISSANAPPISAQRSATQSPSMYSAPSMGGTDPASRARSSGGQSTSTRSTPLLEVWRRAEPRHERAAHVAQKRKRRGERGVEPRAPRSSRAWPGPRSKARATRARAEGDRPSSMLALFGPTVVSSSSTPEDRMATRTDLQNRHEHRLCSRRECSTAGNPLSRVSSRASCKSRA